ncbi:MAG: tetratricopeptide repeat protein [Bacteroidales bacterium]|nr:tetratricopeptide repeat protein [Bacteroidales bacterium]
MDYVDIKKLTLDELIGVINIYPWYGSARKELCRRMSLSGGCSDAQLSDAAMYVVARESLAELSASSEKMKLEDSGVQDLIKSYLPSASDEAEPVAEERRVHVVGGDYFTQADYDKVRRSGDNVFSHYAAKAKEDRSFNSFSEESEFDLYTETLAQIYAEQGYYDKAKSIYSKLILAYPEKSAYFAALIAKIENEIIN